MSGRGTMTSRTVMVLQFERVVDHFFLERRDLSELAAGGDDQLEFIGRMNRALADPA